MKSIIWPSLYTKDRKGVVREWTVSAESDQVVVNHGVKGGAITTSRYTTTPKNVGHANETTGEQQALLEAEAAWKHKLDRKYSLTPEAAQETVKLPMLAKEFKKAKKVKYPVAVQRKLDGNRANASWEDGEIVLTSRGGKVWDKVPHINAAVKKLLPPDSEFDGEFYIHGVPLQTINSAVKNRKHPLNTKLEYHVYDMPTINGDASLPWHKRENAKDAALVSTVVGDTVVNHATYYAEDAEKVKRLHDTFVQEGYEGAIVRIPDAVYEYGHRSNGLLKVKEFQDAEFEIVGFKAEVIERTTDAGNTVRYSAVVWECKNDINELHFETRPKGTYADRQVLYTTGTEWIGRKLTVRFFMRTQDGLPFLPIGHAVRLDEDL